jgi:hypothetical protein
MSATAGSAGPDHLAARLVALEPALFSGLLGLLAAAVIAFGPVLTNDGPAHLAMAHFLVVAGDPAAPMLNRVYEPNPTLSPNLLGHLLLTGLLRVLPPLATEQALQLLILLGIPLAARLALGRLGPGAGWLALFFLSVALQRLFYMGLYNYCLSVLGLLLSLWAWLRLRERTSAGFTVLLALLGLATLASHLSGWLAVMLTIGILAGVEALLRLLAREPPAAALCLPALTALALLPGIALAGLFALQATDVQEVRYGAGMLERLWRVARGEAFAAIGRPTALASVLSLVTLAVLGVAGTVAALRAWLPLSVPQQRLRLACLALPFAFILVLLIVPEQAGGGWTHVWRAEVFPYVALALACAALPMPGLRLRAAAILAGSLAGLLQIGSMARVQAVVLPPVLAEFAALDRLIGPGCTLAPVLRGFQLDAANSARLVHQPLMHASNLLELSKDRPVFYNYLVQASTYPVRYRGDAHPMQLLFARAPLDRATHIRQMTPAAFEARTAIPVDYVLLWDVPEAGRDAWADRLRHDLAEQGYALRHRSASGRLELLGRCGAGREAGSCSTP